MHKRREMLQVECYVHALLCVPVSYVHAMADQSRIPHGVMRLILCCMFIKISVLID